MLIQETSECLWGKEAEQNCINESGGFNRYQLETSFRKHEILERCLKIREVVVYL